MVNVDARVRLGNNSSKSTRLISSTRVAILQEVLRIFCSVSSGCESMENCFTSMASLSKVTGVARATLEAP